MDVMLPSVDSTCVVLHARCDQKHNNSVLMETLRWTAEYLSLVTAFHNINK